MSPWWRVMGHGKSQNALKMGCLKTKNGSNMGQRIFPKVILDHMQWSNKCFWSILTPRSRVLVNGNGGAPEWGRQVGRCPPKTAHFVSPNSLFWRKTAPEPTQNGQTIANDSYTARLDCPVTKSPFLPSSSTTCPRNGSKMAQNGLNVRSLHQTCPKPRTGRILGYVAQNQIPRARSPAANPHCLWFPSLRIAQRDA